MLLASIFLQPDMNLSYRIVSSSVRSGKFPFLSSRFDQSINTINCRSLAAMASSKAKLLVLGVKDFYAFKELDQLPADMEILGIGTVDELLESVGDRLEEVDVLLNTDYGSTSGGKKSINQKDSLTKLWPKLPNLKWVHVGSAGITHILTEDLVKSDVILTNAKGAFSHSLAEYALTCCLYFAKHIQDFQANQKKAAWKRLEVEELRGKQLGVVGYGDIGQTTAKIARTFGMKIAALRRRTELSQGEKEADLTVYSPDKLNDLMASSDYIVTALPATPSTRKFVGAEAIRVMQPHAVFINIGRGTTVDEAALIEALSEKRIRGAALDVFETEPLPKSSKLWGMDNVLISPHCADFTKTWLIDATQQFVENAKLYLQGKDLKNVCDKDAGY